MLRINSTYALLLEKLKIAKHVCAQEKEMGSQNGYLAEISVKTSDNLKDIKLQKAILQSILKTSITSLATMASV